MTRACFARPYLCLRHAPQIERRGGSRLFVSMATHPLRADAGLSLIVRPPPPNVKAVSHFVPLGVLTKQRIDSGSPHLNQAEPFHDVVKRCVIQTQGFAVCYSNTR